MNIADKIRSEAPKADISNIMGEVESLLDEVGGCPCLCNPNRRDRRTTDHIVDVSQMDFEAE